MRSLVRFQLAPPTTTPTIIRATPALARRPCNLLRRAAGVTAVPARATRRARSRSVFSQWWGKQRSRRFSPEVAPPAATGEDVVGLEPEAPLAAVLAARATDEFRAAGRSPGGAHLGGEALSVAVCERALWTCSAPWCSTASRAPGDRGVRHLVNVPQATGLTTDDVHTWSRRPDVPTPGEPLTDWMDQKPGRGRRRVHAASASPAEPVGRGFPAASARAQMSSASAPTPGARTCSSTTTAPRGLRGLQGPARRRGGGRVAVAPADRDAASRPRRQPRRACLHTMATVVAHTLAEENASCAVLRRCGFHRVATVRDPDAGVDAEVWRWELTLTDESGGDVRDGRCA